MDRLRLYFTGNSELKTDESPYVLLEQLGLRLRKAMGEKEVLPRTSFIGGEFRVPTFRTYAHSLNRSVWNAYDRHGEVAHIVPYNDTHEGWDKEHARAHKVGYMASAYNPYEYAYALWDKGTFETKRFHPDLFDDATFGAWLGLLPQPASVIIDDTHVFPVVRISWSHEEPRVHQSERMGRYTLSPRDRTNSAEHPSWRLARAEAYVRAWERMAANEPEDRYKAVMLKERAEAEARFRSR